MEGTRLGAAAGSGHPQLAAAPCLCVGVVRAAATRGGQGRGRALIDITGEHWI